MDAKWLRTFALIAEAELPTRRRPDGQCISGATQKAVLWTIFAHERSKVTQNAIADRSGVAERTVRRTIQVLVELGVLARHRAINRRGDSYTVNPEALVTFVCRTPLTA